MVKIKLFCLPYAGGSAMVYKKWRNYVNDSIEICPVELAGRGKRFSESFYNNFEEAIEDVYKQIKMDVDQYNYAFWGHSMGSLIVFELVHKLRKKNHKGPVHIFFSGRYPPHIKKKDTKVFHTLPDEEFKNEIFRLGGTPVEFLGNKELLDLFLPILRADYRILEEYRYIERNSKFDNDISVLIGKEDDEVSIEDLSQWSLHTSKDCSIYQFDGGHFFINDKIKDFSKIINLALTADQ